MGKDDLLIDLEHIESELLGIHNKIQESINLARDGKWYHADTKMQGTKQKLMNLYEGIKSLKRELSENNSN